MALLIFFIFCPNNVVRLTNTLKDNATLGDNTMKIMRLMLTYDGQDILLIPTSHCETVVYEVQKQVDSVAREQGKPYGKLVSTRRLANNK